MKNILTKNQISAMKECGKILALAMNEVKHAVKPGVSTLSLDKIAEESIRKSGAVPSFKNYEVAGIGRYPASLCVSINSEIVHGIPTNERFLEGGDIVSLDLGAKYKGVCTDMAVTLPVGEISKEAKRLILVTKECLDRGISAAISGHHIGAIGESVQKHAEKNGFGVVRDMVGHGIGEKPHMDPKIPNYGESTDGPRIFDNMALAIEPMITAGDYTITTGRDGWTISTADKSIAAHFEHTVVIVDGLPEIVTL